MLFRSQDAYKPTSCYDNGKPHWKTVRRWVEIYLMGKSPKSISPKFQEGVRAEIPQAKLEANRGQPCEWHGANGAGLVEKTETRLESAEETEADPPANNGRPIRRTTHTCVHCGKQRVERALSVLTNKEIENAARQKRDAHQDAFKLTSP